MYSAEIRFLVPKVVGFYKKKHSLGLAPISIVQYVSYTLELTENWPRFSPSLRGPVIWGNLPNLKLKAQAT